MSLGSARPRQQINKTHVNELFCSNCSACPVDACHHKCICADKPPLHRSRTCNATASSCKPIYHDLEGTQDRANGHMKNSYETHINQNDIIGVRNMNPKSCYLPISSCLAAKPVPKPCRQRLLKGCRRDNTSKTRLLYSWHASSLNLENKANSSFQLGGIDLAVFNLWNMTKKDHSKCQI